MEQAYAREESDEFVLPTVIGSSSQSRLLSGEPCQLSPSDIIFRNLSLRGVWLSMWLQGRESTPESRATVYEELRGYILDGRMHAEIEATYPLDQIKEAVAHALRPRKGKVVILPNG